MIKQIATTTFQSNINDHVGVSGYLFFDPTQPGIKASDGITPGGLEMAGGPILSKRMALTSAQIISTSQPIQLLPAPGAGKIIMVHSTVYSLTFRTTAYNNDNIGLWYGQSVSADISGLGVFNGSGTQIYQALGYCQYYGQPIPDLCINCPINIWSPNNSPTDGDGTGSITVFYSIVTL